MQVVIIVGIASEWKYLLEVNGLLLGSSITNCQKIGLKHKVFIQVIQC